MIEEPLRRRATQSDTTTHVRETAWATDLVQLGADDDTRVGGIVQLEIASGGSVRVCDGGDTPTATNGHLLDAANGPASYDIESTGAVAVYRCAGAPAVVFSSQTKTGIAQ